MILRFGIAGLEGVDRSGGQAGKLRGGLPSAAVAPVLSALDGFQGDAGIAAVFQRRRCRRGLLGLFFPLGTVGLANNRCARKGLTFECGAFIPALEFIAALDRLGKLARDELGRGRECAAISNGEHRLILRINAFILARQRTQIICDINNGVIS